MKKLIIITCITLSALLIFDTMDAGHAIVMFYLAGQIPYTNTSLSASTMLQFFALLTGFVLARLGNRAVISLADRFSVVFRRNNTLRPQL